MGIRVEHRVSGQALGDAAWGAGAAQGSERRREQDRQYQLQQEQLRIREQAQRDAAMQFQMQMRMRQQQMEAQQQQYDDMPQRQLELGRIGNQLFDERAGLELSHQQQQEMARINQAIDYVSRNADGYYSPEEQQMLMQQLTEAKHGIQPTQPKQQMPWPEEQGPGMMWEDDRGNLMTRDHQGNVRVLDKASDSALAPREQFQLNKMVYDMAKDIYQDARDRVENISMDEAMAQARDVLGYDQIMPQQQMPQEDPMAGTGTAATHGETIMAYQQAMAQRQQQQQVNQAIAQFDLPGRLDQYPRNQPRRQGMIFGDSVINNQSAKAEIRNMAAVLETQGLDTQQARQIAVAEYDRLKAEDTGRWQKYPNIDYGTVWSQTSDRRRQALEQKIEPYLENLSGEDLAMARFILSIGPEQQRIKLLHRLEEEYAK